MRAVFRTIGALVLVHGGVLGAQVTAIKAGKFVDADAGTVLSDQVKTLVTSALSSWESS